MSSGAGVCLLASYPRSGNTWLRSMLTACVRPDDAIDFENLVGANVMIDAGWFMNQTGLDPAAMSLDQIDVVRSRLLAALGLSGIGSPVLIKTHSVDRASDGAPRPTRDAVARRSIVLVRHPFDVAVSYAQFISRPIDKIVDAMGRPGAAIDPPQPTRPNRLPELMGSWSENISSWLDGNSDSLLVRYEDMRADPVHWLRAVVNHAGVAVDDAAVRRAVAASDIERLQALERRTGFGDRPAGAAPMFRSGQVGEGRIALTSGHRADLVDSCGAMMLRLGYLPDGTVVGQELR